MKKDMSLDNLLENRSDVEKTLKSAIARATKGHRNKREVKKFHQNYDELFPELVDDVISGSWRTKISYRRLVKINQSNGKVRKIDSPSFYTRIFQHFALILIEPIYFSKDPGSGKNCKKGFGITAKEKKKSVVKCIKSCYYDKTQYEYYLKIDQRKCYDHVTRKTVRKELKKLITAKWLIDYIVDVSFIPGKNYLPIGTPTSPMIHHIIMLSFDYFVRTMTPIHVRYADDNFLAFRTKEEANSAKWRIINYWWYELGIRAKSHTAIVAPIGNFPLDFCGYTFKRFSTKDNKTSPICKHNKGITGLRNKTFRRALKCNSEKSWSSYNGVFLHTDSYSYIVLRKLKDMPNLKELRERIKPIKVNQFEQVTIQALKEENITFDILQYHLFFKGKTSNDRDEVLFTFYITSHENPNSLLQKFQDRVIKTCKTSSPNIVKFFISVEECFDKSECIKSGEDLVFSDDRRRISDMKIDKKPSVGYHFLNFIEFTESFEDYQKESQDQDISNPFQKNNNSTDSN